jgi:NAD(P)-dependent dehydrogenase (short-subunit alcohol dehydrogenase family)
MLFLENTDMYPNTLEGKVALVTGASRGIGKAIALRLAKEGADLIITSTPRSTEELGGVLKSIQSYGRKADSFSVDITDYDAVRAAINSIDDSYGNIDIVVNNAGVFKRKSFEETTMEDREQIMRINYFGPVSLIRSVMENNTVEAVVDISSHAAYVGLDKSGAYGASKAATRRELKDMVIDTGTSLFTISPGLVNTEILSRSEGAEDLAGISSSDKVTPDEVADLVVRMLYAQVESNDMQIKREGGHIAETAVE